MANHACRADHGRRIDIIVPPSRHAACVAVSRQGSLHVPALTPILLIQVRGTSQVTAAEGELTLQPGDWLMLARDSHPLIQTSTHGFCIGLALPPKDLNPATQQAVHIGSGRVGATELRLLLRLWRQVLEAVKRGMDCLRETQSLLRYVRELQHDLQAQIERCPGRSWSHRHRVFNRLQRTRLYLRGHRNKTTRSTELAAIARLSSCYFSRMYTIVYCERPQATASRLRLEYAAELLRETAQPIAEIAAASGFDNCCSFSRAFRAHFDTTASEYRRKRQRAGVKPYAVGVTRVADASGHQSNEEAAIADLNSSLR